MQISKIEDQPSFKANYSRDPITQNVLYRIRRSALENNSHQMTDSMFNILGVVRKNQTLKLEIADDGKKIIAKTKNFWRGLIGKNEKFEQEIVNDDVSAAFVRLGAELSRLW